jgi:hypothetical protein
VGSDSYVSVVTNDASAPGNDSNVWRYFYASGISLGASYFLHGATPAGVVTATHSTIYHRTHFKFEGSDHDIWVIQKLYFFGFGASPSNEGYVAVVHNSGGVEVGPWLIRISLQGGVSRTLDQNVDTTKYFTTAQWHRVEVLLRSNSAPDVADGEARLWIDGHLVVEYTDVVYQTAGDTGLLGNNFRGAATWGGDSAVITLSRDQYIRVAHIYGSGISG